ncbi:DNA-binding protein H-NS [Variovorax sp. GrIS 2.14]|uniref:H-NS family nucleoid-associated regulatory protein n=1 Tax=Variovorax sp. GrIS 2.14 TaxID=3071709 RepID=UPI0038F78C2D
MAKTYEQIQQQIEKLQRQAKALQAVEAEGVIARIKDAIKHYGLTAEQLGFDVATTSAAAVSSAPAPTSAPAAKQTSKPATKSTAKGKAQFSDESGNVWGGRGPRPAWLRNALQAGHDINEFRIGKRAKAKTTPIPLGAAIAAVAPSTNAASAPAAPSKRAKVSYGDDAGHSWSGMGPKPGWLKAALDAGKSLADFAE